MPTVTTEQQRELGEKLAQIIEPFPRDERLLLLVAGLYGEGMSQGMSASQIVEFVARIVRVHERGISPLAITLEDTRCPTCGGVL
jgi:uncharacterized protein YoaH (UPF0181 family)